MGHTLKNLLTQLIHQMENNYFLSSKVYQISNSTGQKCAIYFSQNAYFINIYLFSFLIFTPFCGVYLSKADFQDFNFLFLHEYNSSVATLFVVSLAIFLLIQLLLATRKFMKVKQNQVREEAKQGLHINNFGIVFGQWNWRIQDGQLVNKNQYALMQYAMSFFRYEDKILLDDFQSNNNTFKIILLKMVSLSLVVGSMACTIYLQNKSIILDLTSIPLISEIIHGLVIAIIGKIVNEILSFLNKQKEGFNSKQINTSRYNKQFFAQAMPSIVSILISYNTFLTGNDLTVDFHIFQTQMQFDSMKFECSEQQTSHLLVGLAIGNFVENAIWQYLPSVSILIFQKSSQAKSKYSRQIEFDMMDASIPLIIQNMIIFVLIPFSPFSILLGLLFFAFNFLNSMVITKKLRLPQYNGSPKAYLRAQYSLFYNMSLIFVFCCYALFFRNVFSKDKQISSQSRSCNPFSNYSDSVYEVFIENIRSVTAIRIVYDTLSWYPLVLILCLTYFVSHMTSEGLKQYWKKEVQNKNNEVSGVKIYYEKRIKRLEDKIQEAQNQLVTEEESSSNSSSSQSRSNQKYKASKRNIQEQRKRNGDDSQRKLSLTLFNAESDNMILSQKQIRSTQNTMPQSVYSNRLLKTLKNIKEEEDCNFL